MKKSPLLLIAMNMPLAFSLIFLRPLIPSIIIFCLTNSNTMVYVAWLWTGLEATSPTGCNSFNLTVNAPLQKTICCGVPQGSNLGPFFFLLYINDLNNVSTFVELILFADDTNLFMSHKDPVYLTASSNSELNKLSTWFKANKLSLNLRKTNFMLFKPRQKSYHFPMQICINEQRIEQVKETVFLGVVLDEHLSWKPHISQVARKISKSIGVINRARFFLPKPCLKTHYCLVYPYHHCIIV